MKIVFDEAACEDYQYWQADNSHKKTLRKINNLIKAIARGDDLGKPELLTGDLSGWSSRRIDGEHRLVYRVTDEAIQIAACRGNYT